MASWENLNNICGFELTNLERFHVRSLVQQAKAEFSINFNLETTQLSTFFSRIKKGSKKYRKILLKEKVCLHENKGLRKRLLRQPLILETATFIIFLNVAF